MIGRQTFNVDLPWYTRRFVRNVLGQATRSITQAQRAAHSPIEEAPLFVADTRPAMFFGVPHVLAVLLIAAFGESIIFVGPTMPSGSSAHGALRGSPFGRITTCPASSPFGS